MPIVPGTKVWLRNKELAHTVAEMEKTHPIERTYIAHTLAETTIKRQRQALSNYTAVYRFILNIWFKDGHLAR